MSELLSVLDSVRGHRGVYDQIIRETAPPDRHRFDWTGGVWLPVWDNVAYPISEHIREAAELERRKGRER